MKRNMLTLFVLLMATPFGAALPADGPDRPSGVAAKDWIQVSERVGIVLAHQTAPTPPIRGDASALLLRPPANGYLMVKGSSGWTRLVIVEPTKGPGDAG